MKETINTIKCINKLKQYCKENSINLEFTWILAYTSTGKRDISLNPYGKLNNVLNNLLHEIGRTISYSKMSNEQYLDFVDSLSHINYAKMNKNFKTFLSPKDLKKVVIEEKKASIHGKKIANELNLTINQSSYNKIKNKNIRNHIKWYKNEI